jgi:methyl coenzyme M reductase beta subunit
MSMTNTMETALLALIYNNTGLANMGDATGLLPAGTVGSLYVSLPTADP